MASLAARFRRAPGTQASEKDWLSSCLRFNLSSFLALAYRLCSSQRVSNTATMFAEMLGACLPGILFYIVIQTRIRQKPTTAIGFLVVVMISLTVAMPGILSTI